MSHLKTADAYFNTRMEDEIVINGEVYVRKRADIAPAPSARLSSPALAVHSIQDKLNRTKLGGQQIGNSGQGDLPDGAALSVQNVQTIKQSLRYSEVSLRVTHNECLISQSRRGSE